MRAEAAQAREVMRDAQCLGDTQAVIRRLGDYAGSSDVS
jgi:hypothetical protein